MCFLWVDGPDLQNVAWLQFSKILMCLQHSIFWFGPHKFPAFNRLFILCVYGRWLHLPHSVQADARTVVPDTPTAPSDSKLFPNSSSSSSFIRLCGLQCPQINFWVRSLLVWIYNPKSWSLRLRVCWEASLCLWIRDYRHLERIVVPSSSMLGRPFLFDGLDLDNSGRKINRNTHPTTQRISQNTQTLCQPRWLH
jgi:hypothetical protein